MNSKPPLEFTGNWFIDAGILGFVNLMEEVYSGIWDSPARDDFLDSLYIRLSKLKDKLKNFFIYAFWYKTIKDTTLRWIHKDNFKKKILKDSYNIDSEELTKNIEGRVSTKLKEWNSKNVLSLVDKPNQEVYQMILEFNDSVKSLLKDSYVPYKSALRKIYASNKKTIIDNLGNIGLIAYNNFFTNLNFFNPASNKQGKEQKILAQFEDFLNSYFVRKDKKVKSLPVDLFDKALSPFIYSAADFNNQLYGTPTTLGKLEKIFGINPVYYLLSFPLAFIWVQGRYYLFYSPQLDFTYKVNRELGYLLSSLKETPETIKRSIFEVTWEVILDRVNEYRAISSLENMYIIEYSDITNQQIQNVEYIGISKLEASFIIDDTIRDALNKSIPTPKKDANRRTIWVWLLKEFIKNRPLLPHIIAYTHGLVADKWTGNERGVGKYTLITALAVDAVIKEMESSKVYGENVFDDTFFSNYKEVVAEVKRKISSMYYSSQLALKIVEETDRDKMATLLFGKVKGRNKYGFVNTLLKYTCGRAEQNDEIGQLVGYLFNNILQNDICWENYALSLVLGLLKGGERNEEKGY